jgi:hypothetical protein
VESRPRRSVELRSIKKKAKAEGPTSALSLPNITQFLEDYGEINVRTHSEIGCVATAADEDCTYATLVRRGGESLVQLLIRLDQALDKALTLGIFTDQISR